MNPNSHKPGVASPDQPMAGMVGVQIDDAAVYPSSSAEVAAARQIAPKSTSTSRTALELLEDGRERLQDVLVDNHIERVSLKLRLFEICVAVVVLFIAAPLMLAIAWIIRRGTPGPAIFRQVRVGAGVRPFYFYKYRTLFVDARERFPELYAYKYSPKEIQTLRFKVEDDPRVTPQGVWLRPSTLDELPNFWNVLRGDMALVGPRPEIPEMLPYYEGRYMKKFAVRPGITGLAQTSGRGRLTFFETADYDLEYVENRTFWLDLKIIAKTIVKLLSRDGAF